MDASLIARSVQMQILGDSRERLQRGHGGSLVWIPAESGYGKTELLKTFLEETLERFPAVEPILVKAHAPIGNVKIGSLQPLYPFAKIMEELARRESAAPEKKLALNIGMTLLSMVPILGELPYALKEIKKDVQEFRREKKSGRMHSAATVEFFEALKTFSEKKPLILLLDDMHYCDAESIELLSLLQEELSRLPIMLAAAYRPSAVHDNFSPLLSATKEWKPDGQSIFSVTLPEFSKEEMARAVKMMLKPYNFSPEFEQWLWNKSSGIPGLVVEYLHYFEKKSPFNADGALSEEFLQGDILPMGVHAAFSKMAEQLDDEDRTLLALCSAEGRECSVHVIAKLLSADTLTAVRRLRALQRKTGLIKSAGAQQRYGVKTTIYEFTQGYYQQYFHNLLEYEERVALHQQIAEILKQQYNSAEDDAARRRIAPYILAHGMEADDADGAARLMAADLAEQGALFGNDDIVREALELQQLLRGTSDEQTNAEELERLQELLLGAGVSLSKPVEKSFDFAEIQQEIITLFLAEDYGRAAEQSSFCLHEHGEKLLPYHVAMLCAFIARALTETGEYHSARERCDEGLALLQAMPNPAAECLLLNARAIIETRTGNNDAAQQYFLRAALPSPLLPNEYRMLTAINIGFFLEERSPGQSLKYKKAALQMAKSFDFQAIVADAWGKANDNPVSERPTE